MCIKFYPTLFSGEVLNAMHNLVENGDSGYANPYNSTEKDDVETFLIHFDELSLPLQKNFLSIMRKFDGKMTTETRSLLSKLHPKLSKFNGTFINNIIPLIP